MSDVAIFFDKLESVFKVKECDTTRQVKDESEGSVAKLCFDLKPKLIQSSKIGFKVEGTLPNVSHVEQTDVKLIQPSPGQKLPNISLVDKSDRRYYREI